MIYHIQGTIIHLNDPHIIIDTGSLAFDLMVPKATAFNVRQQITLLVYMHWNQEQGPSLYGFQTSFDKTVFLLIISCSGIGPKIALSLLSTMGASQFLHALVQEKAQFLSKVPGIGLKKAEQLIVNLRGKAAKLLESATGIEENQDTMDHITHVAQALSSLRYTSSEVALAIRYLNTTYPSTTLPFDQLMRHALSFLAKKA